MPPKAPAARALVSNIPAISVDDEQMYNATHRCGLEQLQAQVAQRAKGHNVVDYYEKGMTPILSYIFFVAISCESSDHCQAPSVAHHVT